MPEISRRAWRGMGARIDRGTRDRRGKAGVAVVPSLHEVLGNPPPDLILVAVPRPFPQLKVMTMAVRNRVRLSGDTDADAQLSRARVWGK